MARAAGEVWRLMRQDELVGEITVEEADQPWLHGRFTAGPAFMDLAPLFRPVADFLLRVQGEQAWFRWSDEPFVMDQETVLVIGEEAGSKQRFLILHDYGMGGSWWWVRARSAREVLETFAEVEVIEAPDAIERAEGWDLEEADVDVPTMPAGLADLYATRQEQRRLPGFGALADRTIMYLRRRWDGDDGVDPAVYLMEIGPDGRRLRQVELTEDGEALRSEPDDWPFNPPVVDLFDPELEDLEISRDDFEAIWHRARKDDRDL